MNGCWRRLTLSIVALALVVESAPAQERIEAGPGAWTDATRWQVVERFRIGSLDGPLETTFGDRQLSIATIDNRILVLDHRAHEIRVFDEAGGYVETVGREGEGPGEFASPTGIILAPNGQWWVPEAFARRYSVFSPEGDFLHTVPRTLRGYNRLRELRFESSGVFIDHSTVDGGAGFFRVDTLGVLLDSLPRLKYPPLPVGVGGPILNGPDSPVRPAIRFGLDRLVWTLAPDLTLWFGYSNEYRLIQRTVDGDTLRMVYASHRAPRFTHAESDIARAAERELGFRNVFTPQIWRGIHVLDDGHLIVHVNGEFGITSSELDVFAPSGRFLGTLELPFRMPHRSTPAFDGNRMIAVAMDEYDVQYVVALDLVRE